MATRKSTKKLKPSKADLIRWQLRTFVLRDLQRRLDPNNVKFDIALLRKVTKEEADDVSKFGLSRGQMDRLADKMLVKRPERR